MNLIDPKFLKEAFEWKYKHRSATIFRKGGLELPFNNEGGKIGIFQRARENLPPIYRDLGHFPDSEEGNMRLVEAVIEKLERHQDQTLETYFKPTEESSEQMMGEGEKTAGQETFAAGEAETQQAGDRSFGTPGLASATPTRTGRRAVHNIPQAKEEGPTSKLLVANKSGHVIEERSVGPTSTTINKPQTPSRLVIADKGGAVIGERIGGKTIAPVGGSLKSPLPSSESKLFIANRSGTVVGERVVKNVGSSAGISLKKGLTRGGSQAGNMLGNLVGNGGGIPGRIFRKPNGFSGVKAAASAKSSASSIFKFSKKVKVLLVLAWLLPLFLASALAGIITNTPIPVVGGAPAPNGLTYTLPLKDASVVPVDIRNQIRTAFPNAKLEYWNLIIQTTKNAGINPAVALALWIEETGASQTTVVRNGGSGIPTSGGALTVGHLGCAPTEDQTINESLNCLIKFVNNNNFTNTQFPEFMAKYSGGPASNPFSNNPNFVNNFRNWYVRLVPSGSGAIKNITPSPGTPPGSPIAPGSLGFALSCPLGNSFTVTCGTAANPVNNCGHGGIGYSSTCDPTYYACNGTRYSDALYHAIDVKGGGSVRLPFINGTESVEWVKDGSPIAIGGGSWGYRVNYRANYNGKRIYLDLTHLNSQINPASTLRSGDEAGIVFASIGHLHTAVSVNDRWVEPIQELRMCSN